MEAVDLGIVGQRQASSLEYEGKIFLFPKVGCSSAGA